MNVCKVQGKEAALHTRKLNSEGVMTCLPAGQEDLEWVLTGRVPHIGPKWLGHSTSVVLSHRTWAASGRVAFWSWGRPWRSSQWALLAAHARYRRAMHLHVYLTPYLLMASDKNQSPVSQNSPSSFQVLVNVKYHLSLFCKRLSALSYGWPFIS